MKLFVLFIILFFASAVLAEDRNIDDSNLKEPIFTASYLGNVSNKLKSPKTDEAPIVPNLNRVASLGRMGIERKIANPTDDLANSMRDVENERLRKELKFDTEKKSAKSTEDSIRLGKFHWKPAIQQSLLFLAFQHGVRLFQDKTRREFPGPFFADWFKSAGNIGGWEDQDPIWTNYVAHPMQGSLTGRFFLNNSDASRNLSFGKSKQYWQSRAKTMLWSALWSTQFELGPVSEANIGNVGLYDDIGPKKMGWVDMVMTPTLGTGFLIGEDIIDKYLLQNWIEKKNYSRKRVKVMRSILTPIWSISNLFAGKMPWDRGDRR